MLHFVDRFLVLDLAEALHPPVVEHARMQEILIDGCQLVLQRLIEEIQNCRVALHARPFDARRRIAPESTIVCLKGASEGINRGCGNGVSPGGAVRPLRGRRAGCASRGSWTGRPWPQGRTCRSRCRSRARG